MARIVKEDEYSAKRNDILDVALGLIYTRGYEQMTIQDILDGLKISRGAFYHYFDSKQALLEALVERMGRESEAVLLPIVEDSNLTALEKFRRYFEASAQWKNMQKELIVSLMRMWYTQENALIRQKLSAESLKHMSRLLEPMIRQGIEEKVFTTPFPEQSAGIIVGIALGLSDSIIGLLLAAPPDPANITKFEMLAGAYIDAIERILGAAAGSLKIFDPESFKNWLTAVQPASAK